MKALNIVAGIIAVIALIGDLVFMFVLVNLGEALTAFSELAVADFQEISQTFSLVLGLGWLWAILVLLACLFTIKMAFFPKKK